jgi:nucleotide-binding universal stress UspA family protein
VYRRILVGYDGSGGSRDAVALARSLAASDGTELIVAAALHFDPLATPAQAYERAVAEAEERLGASARELLGDAAFSIRCVGGVSAPRALTELAHAEDADVIVIGSTHRGGIGRVFPGSVGERLLQGAPCAVLVAPRDFARRRDFGLRQIGVAFDGREESREALAAASSLAGDLGAQLSLIAVAGQVDLRDRAPDELPPVREKLQRELESAAAAVGHGVEATTELISGSPAAALAERGADLDLLVIGSRGYGPIRHALLGGVSAEVIRTAPCPVLVVPRSAT